MTSQNDKINEILEMYDMETPVCEKEKMIIKHMSVMSRLYNENNSGYTRNLKALVRQLKFYYISDEEKHDEDIFAIIDFIERTFNLMGLRSRLERHIQ